MKKGQNIIDSLTKKTFGFFINTAVLILNVLFLLVPKKKIQKKKIKKILVIQFEHIGDLLLSTPTFRALKETFPKAQLTLVIGSWSKPIVEGNPHIDHLIIFDNPVFDRQRNKTNLSLKKIIKFIKLIRKEKFDLALEFRGKLNSLFLLYLSGAKYKLGYNIQSRGFFLDVRVKPKRVHDIERHLRLVRAIGADTQDKRPFIQISQKDENQIKSFLKKEKVDAKDFIVTIHPTTPWPPRNWPVKRFAKVADYLVEKYEAKIILVGSQQEKNSSIKLSTLMEEKNKKNVISAVGKTNIKQLAALLKKTNLFIGNDSGPMHIASAMNTPTIALFGPGDHIRFKPCGKFYIMLRRNLKCSPCRQLEFGNVCKFGLNLCKGLEQISVQEVLRAADKLIRQSKLNKKLKDGK